MDAAMLEQVAVAERPRLLGIAYRMTGSYADAEDIVQEAMLRVHRAAPTDIDTPAAYLTTITTRAYCMNATRRGSASSSSAIATIPLAPPGTVPSDAVAVSTWASRPSATPATMLTTSTSTIVTSIIGQ